MDKIKTFALIIPAYIPEYIIDCVNSIVAQEQYPGWKYDIRIGVDGCQETSEILMRHKIRHWYSQSNVGAYIMRNSLMFLKPADAYGCFDADDVMNPDYFKKTIMAIESGSKVIMLAKTEVDEHLNSFNRPPHVQYGGAISFTHEILQTIGGFRSFRCAGDSDLMCRINMAGYEIQKINDSSYYLRRNHRKSLTRGGPTKYGGQYRDKVWAEMCADRQKGIIKINPSTVKLKLVQ